MVRVPIKVNFVGSSLTGCKLVGIFLNLKIISGKRERRTFVGNRRRTFDENRRAEEIMLNLSINARIKIKGTYRGGEGGATPVTTACPEDR